MVASVLFLLSPMDLCPKKQNTNLCSLGKNIMHTMYVYTAIISKWYFPYKWYHTHSSRLASQSSTNNHTYTKIMQIDDNLIWKVSNARNSLYVNCIFYETFVPYFFYYVFCIFFMIEMNRNRILVHPSVTLYMLSHTLTLI